MLSGMQSCSLPSALVLGEDPALSHLQVVWRALAAPKLLQLEHGCSTVPAQKDCCLGHDSCTQRYLGSQENGKLAGSRRDKVKEHSL